MEWNSVEEQSGRGVGVDDSHDPFPPSNPQVDINCGQFVALSVLQEEVEARVPFYVRKVIEEGKNRWRINIKVC